MQFPPPSVAFTQLLSAICIMMGCEHKYPAPVQNIVTSELSSTYNSPSYVVVREDGSTSTSTGKIVTRRGRLAGKDHLLRSDADLSNQLGDDDDLEQSDDDHVMLPPIVEIPGLGRVQGYHMRVVSGRQIYAFEGIPYANPPVGRYRFQAPAPHQGWNATTNLDAKDPGPPCIQLVYGRIKGSEDCLRLNVYSPKIPSGKIQQKRYPVIIFIHGGLFLAGAGSNFGPAYLLRENVILVTFNYRLGIMGAFSTGDSAASGNWGLKDQAFAINWVHKHISSFGGDPDHLVIMGQSAGGVCAHLQMMSPLARDKLRAAITISGGAYNFWGLNSLDQGLRVSRSSARFARCSLNQGSPTLLACMQNASAEVLVANQIFTFGSALPVPMIEPPVAGAFLSETPDSAYQKGHVARIPLIMTVTSEEINAYIAEITGRGGTRILNGLFDVDAASLLGLRGIPSSSERITVNKIRGYYGIGGRRVLIPRQLFTQVGNARYFTVPFHRSVQMHSQLAPTYAGIFNYTNNPIGRAERLGVDPKEFGVSHTDDLIFVLNSTNKPPITENHYGFAVTKLITNMYANFGKSNIPSFTGEDGNLYNFWDSVVNPENFQILQIDEEVKMIDNPYTKAAKFWESLHIPDMKPYIKLSLNKSS